MTKPFCTVNKKCGMTVTFGDEVFHVPDEAINDLLKQAHSNEEYMPAMDVLISKVDEILELIKSN